MPWYALYRTDTGQLLSLGTVAPEDSPANTSVAEVAGPIDDSRVWDDATRAMIPRPAEVLVDRIQDLADDPVLSAVWSRLTAAQRTTLRNRLIAFVGRQRWRGEGERVDLD